MPFFDKKTTQSINEFDLHCASTLNQALRQHNKVMRPAKLESWARHFQTLRVKNQVSMQRIQDVLAWYTINIGQPYVPQAYSADSFRHKFVKLEAAYGRREVKLEITPEAKSIEAALLRRYWPAGKEQLAKVVQMTISSVRDFQSRMNLLRTHPDRKVCGFAEWLWAKFGTPISFTTNWWLDVNTDVANWDDWSGDLEPFVFSLDSKRLWRMGRRWAEQYCNDGVGRWNLFMESMRNASGETGRSH